MADYLSSIKNIGSSAFSGSGSSGSSSSSSSGSGSNSNIIGGLFSNFFNLTIQKIVLLLACIAFVISVATVAILLWKSKSAQKWPPEISKCPDRMVLNVAGTECSDTYGLGVTAVTPNTDLCTNYANIKDTKYTAADLSSSDGYAPWEGIVNGKGTKSSNLKCAT
jgi:hypothetical protein